MLNPIQLGKKSSKASSGLPQTWQPPCPSGTHTLKVLERRNGGDESSDDETQPCKTRGNHNAASPPLLLIQAAKSDDCARLKSLLTDGHAAVELRDQHGATALSWASRHGNVEMISMLLAHRAPVDAADSMQWSPLMEAAFSRAPDAVRELLSAGANARHENRSNESALSIARDVKSEACVDLLVGALSREEALVDCAKSGDVHRMNALLQADGGLELLASACALLHTSQRHHSERCTLLHWASANGSTRGHVSCIEALVEHRCAVDGAAPGSGWTSLMAAASNHQVDAVRALLAARADPLLVDSSGGRASGFAAGSRECEELLERAEAAALEQQQRQVSIQGVVAATGLVMPRASVHSAVSRALSRLSGRRRSVKPMDPIM